jgi:ribonuclease BN (tRNA processing enzyme)
MKLTFIGTGTLNSKEMFHSNALFETPDGKRMLLDCGADCRHALKATGLWWENIDAIYLSHLHGDHCGGLEQIGFARKFNPNLSLPELFISEFLSDRLWENTLSGGMRSLQNEINRLSTYFKVHPIPENGTFKWRGVDFRPVQVIHIYDGFSIVPSFGLRFEIDRVKVFYTADSQFCPNQIMDFYNWADIIFQDCETLPFKSGVHANIIDLVKLPEDTRAKMWLYHYQDGALPDAKELGFRGFVKQGQTFDFLSSDTLK